MSSPLLNTATCSSPTVGVFDTLVTTLLQALLVGQCSISPPSAWPQDYAEQALQNQLTSFDFVVVGAGSAGSVVASRLSENPNYNVLVLEAGGNPPPESAFPQFFMSMILTNASWNFYTEPDNKFCLGSVGERCLWPRGKMLGGCHGLNVNLYIRGNEDNFNTWAEMGNTEWSYEKVQPYFQKAETTRGNESFPLGYVSVEPYPPYELDIREMVISGAEELNLPYVNEFVKGSYIGVSKIPGTLQNGRRASTAKTYVAAVDNRPNLKIIKNAVVKKINFNTEGDQVESISYEVNGTTLDVQIEKEAILSAGSINSAQLLMLSGIGPQEHLKSLNIPVIKNLSVGNNLQDHLMSPLFVKLQKNTTPYTQHDLYEDTVNALLNNSSPFDSIGVSTVTQFLNLSTNNMKSSYPDSQIHCIYFQRGQTNNLNMFLSKTGYKDEYVNQLLEANTESGILIFLPVLLQPKSIGNLKLRSSNQTDPPLIYPNYLEKTEDLEALIRILKFLDREVQTKAFQAFGAEIFHVQVDECDNFEFKSKDYWACYIKYFTTTIYHPVGTVKMGPESDPTSCVNQELKVHGINNMRVIDGGIMPKIVSSNPNAPTIMIAERGAEFIQNYWNNQN